MPLTGSVGERRAGIPRGLRRRPGAGPHAWQRAPWLRSGSAVTFLTVGRWGMAWGSSTRMCSSTGAPGRARGPRRQLRPGTWC